jgi:multimeric flavodoxin WrbA
MNRNVLILKASPRARGNSATLAEQAMQGAQSAGASVECVYLNGMNITPCNGCDLCRKSEEMCVFDDDMQDLYPKILAADALILASPVFWFTYSAQLKLCIDRWYGLWNHHKDFLKGKPVGIILAYGDENLELSGGINAVRSFESMLKFLDAPVAGIVHGSLSDIGDAQKHPDLMEQAYQLGRLLAGGH